MSGTATHVPLKEQQAAFLCVFLAVDHIHMKFLFKKVLLCTLKDLMIDLLNITSVSLTFSAMGIKRIPRREHECSETPQI